MWPNTVNFRSSFRKSFTGRKVFLGVDDFDIFKGIELKLQAFELLLSQHPEMAEDGAGAGLQSGQIRRKGDAGVTG